MLPWMPKRRSPGLRVLLLDENPRDAELVTHALRTAHPGCSVLRVDNEPAFVDALSAFDPDVVLADQAATRFDACDALTMVMARSPGVPFLLVSDTFEQTALRCLRNGAADFVRKSDLPRLSSAIRAALEMRASLRTLSKRQRQVLQLLASGSSTREIAKRLGVSVKTAETHRGQAMKRLKIHDVPGLVRYAVRVGLVSAAE
jgi:DNA-binding NarL/FixJ family response regulator